MATRQCSDRYIDSDTWLSRAVPGDGSWWPAWAAWLESKSDAERVAPPSAGAPSRWLTPLCAAPGVYVHEH
jgi:polyhydroxyalkanoate synthase